MAKAKDKKMGRGPQKAGKATKQQGRNQTSKSGKPSEPKSSPFHFLRTSGERDGDPRMDARTNLPQETPSNPSACIDFRSAEQKSCRREC